MNMEGVKVKNNLPHSQAPPSLPSRGHTLQFIATNQFIATYHLIFYINSQESDMSLIPLLLLICGCNLQGISQISCTYVLDLETEETTVTVILNIDCENEHWFALQKHLVSGDLMVWLGSGNDIVIQVPKASSFQLCS